VKCFNFGVDPISVKEVTYEGIFPPLSKILPLVICCLLERALRRVVLPPPEGPMMERSSPGLATPLTPSRMVLSVNSGLKTFPDLTLIGRLLTCCFFSFFQAI